MEIGIAIFVMFLIFGICKFAIDKENKYIEIIEILKEQNGKLHSKQKSEQVRFGFLAEKLAPFLQGFPTDTNDLQHLGQPIDYVHFGEDKITFIEVKSGKSKLTKKQKYIKMLIEEGKVGFEEYRIE